MFLFARYGVTMTWTIPVRRLTPTLTGTDLLNFRSAEAQSLVMLTVETIKERTSSNLAFTPALVFTQVFLLGGRSLVARDLRGGRHIPLVSHCPRSFTLLRRPCPASSAGDPVVLRRQPTTRWTEAREGVSQVDCVNLKLNVNGA